MVFYAFLVHRLFYKPFVLSLQNVDDGNLDFRREVFLARACVHLNASFLIKGGRMKSKGVDGLSA